MITEIEAISFLKEHQPMPSDVELKEDERQMYEQVVRYFIDNPNERCVPLFLNSFGGKDGLGVYQMVENVILTYDKEIVLPHVLNGFNSLCNGIQYWCIQIASCFPDERLFEPLVAFFRLDDEDIKLATIDALAQLALNNINKKEVINVIETELRNEEDEYVMEFAEEVLSDIKNN